MAEKRMGQVVFDPTEKLGVGGMGVVFKGRHLLLNQTRAIKFMRDELRADEASRQRFLREAQNAQPLVHDNIIRIIDVDIDDEMGPYITMEFIEGADLRSLIEKRALIPFKQKVRIIIDILKALAYAHSLPTPLVHRDISPPNVRITLSETQQRSLASENRLSEIGAVKLLDFGIAKAASETLTGTGIIGKPHYMSPEQATGHRDLDGRSDLWAVTVVLFELITYSKPFDADQPLAILNQICSMEAPSLTDYLPGCAPELLRIIDRGLAKNRDDRYPSAQEFIADLEQFLAGLPAEVDRLGSEVQSLKNRIEDCRNQLEQDAPKGTFDRSLFVVEEPKAYRDDYGTLLLVHAKLQGQAELAEKELEVTQAVRDLWERSRDQYEAGDWTECIQTLDRLLDLRPDNPEVQALRADCQEKVEEERRRKERQETLRAHLSDARNAVLEKRFDEASDFLSVVLEIDPTHSEALSLRDQIEEGVRHLNRIRELRDEALELEKAGDLETCLKICEEGLALDGGAIEFSEIQERTRTALRRRERITTLVQEVEDHLQHKRYAPALACSDEILAEDPGNQKALALQSVARKCIQDQRRLKELVKQSKRADEQGNYKACLGLVNEGLSIDAAHPELLRLKSLAEAALEQERRIRELLDHGQDLLARHVFDSVDEKVKQVLELDPTNVEAQELKKQVREGKRRQREVETHLARATSYKRAGNHADCSKECLEILKLDAQHPEAAELLAWARAGLELQERIQDLLREARHWAQVGDYPATRDSARAALELHTEHPDTPISESHLAELQTLLEAAEKQLERQRRIDQLLHEARQQLQQRHFHSAVSRCGEVLGLEPGQPEALRLHAVAKEGISNLEKVMALLAEAKLRRKRGDYRACLNVLVQIRELNPHHREAQTIREWAESVEALIKEAEEAWSARDYQTCHKAATRGLDLSPNENRFKELQKLARSAIDRTQRIQNFLREAENQLTKREFDAVLSTVGEIEKIEVGHPEAARLKKSAEDGIEAGRLCQQSRQRFESGDLEQCRKLCDSGLRLDSGSPELKSLQQQVELAIRLRTQKEERRRRVVQLLESAQRALDTGRPKVAIRDLDSLLHLEAAHARALKLRGEAQRLQDEIGARRWITVKKWALRLAPLVVLLLAIWIYLSLREPPPPSDAEAWSQVDSRSPAELLEHWQDFAENCTHSRTIEEALKIEVETRLEGEDLEEALSLIAAAIDHLPEGAFVDSLRHQREQIRAFIGLDPAANPEELEQFLVRFPSGPLADKIRRRLEGTPPPAKEEETLGSADLTDDDAWAGVQARSPREWLAHFEEFSDSCSHTKEIERRLVERIRSRMVAGDLVAAGSLADDYRTAFRDGDLKSQVDTLVQQMRDWGRVDQDSKESLETFVDRYPTSPLAEYAKTRLAAMIPGRQGS